MVKEKIHLKFSGGKWKAVILVGGIRFESYDEDMRKAFESLDKKATLYRAICSH